MTAFNIIITALELLFGLGLVVMFMRQERLVAFEKRTAVLLRYGKRRILRHIRSAIRQRRLKKHLHFNQKCLYMPALPSTCPDFPDRVA